MERFGYIRAQTVSEAVRLLDEAGVRSRVLCGGTDLMVQLRKAPPDFDRLVDVSLIAEMKVIAVGERMRLGAAVTFAEVMENDWLQQRVPFLVQACASVGAVQVRNTGTLGGNIANAAACADTLPVLVCLDTEVVIASARGERRQAISQFVQGPYKTTLQPGELVVAFEFDAPPPRARTTFVKLGRRNAMAISRLSVAAMGQRDEQGRVCLMRIAPGAAFTHTRRAVEVEEALLGRIPDDETISSAAGLMARAMIAESGRRWSTEYKEPVIVALTRRAIEAVLKDEG